MIAIFSILMSLAFAGSPPVVARHAFVTETGDRYFVVTQSGHEWGLYEVDAVGAVKVDLNDARERDRGWDLDLRLNDHRRITIPPSAHRRAYVMHPNRAPQRLLRREVTIAELARLGLNDLVTVANAEAKVPSAVNRELPKAPSLILITPPLAERVEFLARLAAELRTHGVTVLRSFSSDLVIAIAPGEDLSRITDALRQIGAPSVVALNRELTALREEFTAERARATLESDQGNLPLRLSALVSLSARATSRIRDLRAIRRGLHQFASLIESLRANVPREEANVRSIDQTEWTRLTTAERLAFAQNMTRRTAFYSEVIDPLTKLYAEVLRNVKRLNHVQAERLLLQTAAPAGAAGFKLLSFDAWLAWLDERIDLLAEVPSPRTYEELRDLGWFVDSINIGLGEPRVEIKLIDANRTDVGDGFAHEISQLVPSPLGRLGHDGDQRIWERKLLDFIVRADHRVAESLPSFKRSGMLESLLPPEPSADLSEAMRSFLINGVATDAKRALLVPYGLTSAASDDDPYELKARVRRIERRAQPDGSAVIHRLLTALRWPKQDLRRDRDFDMDRYYMSGMNLIMDLLEAAEDSLRTRGTYASALHVGLQLTSAPTKTAAARERQIELDAVIKRHLLHHVARLSGGCAADLSITQPKPAI